MLSCVTALIGKFRWGLWLWFFLWVVGFLWMGRSLWKAVWVGLAIIYGGAYYLLLRSKTDTERGLQKASSILTALVGVQIAVLMLVAFARR